MAPLRLVVLGLVVAGAAAPSSAAETWCGEFDYPSFATKAPLNISITGATASVNSESARSSPHRNSISRDISDTVLGHFQRCGTARHTAATTAALISRMG